MPGSTLVLVTATPRGPLAARLQAVLVTGRTCGVVGVVWGDWRGGACVHADGDGLVWAADRGPGDGLRGVRLYGLGAAEVPDLLALLDSVEPAPADRPHTAALRGLAWAPSRHRRLPAAPRQITARPAEGEQSSTDRTAPARLTPVDDGESDTATDRPRSARRTRSPTLRHRPSATARRLGTGSRRPSHLHQHAGWSPGGCARHGPRRAPALAPLPGRGRPGPITAGHSRRGAEQPAGRTPGPGADDGADPAEQDAADLRPHPGCDHDTPPRAAGELSTRRDAELPSRPGPITLRILGRPTLLVARPAADDPPAAAPTGDGVDGVDTDFEAWRSRCRPPGAVEVTATLSARMRDLLVYLAVHPDGVRRDTAVAELWPDTGRRPTRQQPVLADQPPARRRPRRPPTPHDPATVDRAGRGDDRVGPIVLVEGDRYRLDHTHIAVDYWSFLADAAATTAAIAEPTPRLRRGDDVLERLQRAHELYRGPLAEGIDHAWILSVREATRRTFLTVTARLVRHHVATDPAAALAILETVRNLEPTNQSIYRDIMALQLRLGDNDAAAATLRLLENQLADIEESLDDATQALARAILE